MATAQDVYGEMLRLGIRPALKSHPLEAILGCPDDVRPSDLIAIRSEPAHDEAFTTISKTHWAYPTILAEPDAIGDNDLICDIAFPLGRTA